ncbi:MAG: hypothetical protein KDA99_17320, partial [Planctomycetales bacterium]|nr:hypothetical protein [Planctomycetales bacterium]
MKKINFLAGLCVLVATLAVAGHVRGADIATSVIDFESGTVNNGEARAENLFVSEITTPDNVVSFGLDGIDVVPVLALSNSGVQAAFNVKPSGP